ncbi:hypothetical protein [Streptomyces hilarionis]|uniref:hypothetical protein n=1 Tax=Streptomyces hilarionis TaxID=2839954 RepID=UPI00211A03DF|nr:hypothetical protein [Streptomyces hilarionis]MCQ9134881.1 hypothetical protein [Streptomyces hilarionis]
MNGSREQSPRSTSRTEPTEPTEPAAPGAGRGVGRGVGRALAARGPWTVLCAVAAVVLGPAAATASALEQANEAPLHHAVRTDRAQAYPPADSTRRRPA